MKKIILTVSALIAAAFGFQCLADENRTAMDIKDDGRSLTITSGEKPVLTYNYAVTPAKEGVRAVYARSGYIHPAYTPSGFIYTNIQPDDHPHHYGIWNPWTKVEYEGKVYDLWNLGDSLGCVRAKKIEEIYRDGESAGFNAVLEHVIFAPKGEKVIMTENWIVRARETEGGFEWDFESVLKPCADKPVTIKEYRYEGFGLRATDKWTRDNCTMMTSAGNTRQSIDFSRGDWIYVNGSAEGTKAGILIMSCPENFNSPELLRIWDENANGGRGDVFINFCPTKDRDWVLESGKQYSLKYRVIASDEHFTPEKAAQNFKDYAYARPVDAVKIGNRIDISIDGEFFTSYRCYDDEKYPFFFPVNGPASGASVTSMRNSLWPHHTSLFFGCDLVNGGNYWQEGLERGRIISLGAEIVETGTDKVVIEDRCIWKRPGAESPFKDSRRITVTSPCKDIYQLDFDIVMEALEDVKILRTNHSLFSARIADDLTVKQGGVMVNNLGDRGEQATFGVNASWMGFYGERKTGTEGIVIMQHPSNRWYPSKWFTRDYGFMSPTPMWWPEDGEATCLKKGETVPLRYRVIIHKGTPEEAGIQALFDKYTKE